MEYREYRFVEKASGGPGPWQEEPDKIQFEDAATGMPCLIVRHPSSGHLCGYVGVPPGHPLHGVDCDEVIVDVEVHGGLTYSAFCMENVPEDRGICHVPASGEPDRVWWLGFDMAHAGDLSPGLLSDAHRLSLESAAYFSRGAYRGIEYVRQECAQVAAQLAVMAPVEATP